jgi:putative transposase
VAEAVRSIGVTQFTYYRWRKEYRRPEDEPGEAAEGAGEGERAARKAVSDLTLEKLILREAASGNF